MEDVEIRQEDDGWCIFWTDPRMGLAYWFGPYENQADAEAVLRDIRREKRTNQMTNAQKIKLAQERQRAIATLLGLTPNERQLLTETYQYEIELLSDAPGDAPALGSLLNPRKRGA